MARSRIEVLLREQFRHCQEISRQHPRDEVVSKALRSAEKALLELQRCDSAVVESAISQTEAIRTYTQSVLDSTYHQECRLVEGGFPDDITKNEISAIIGSISKPISLCGPIERIQPTLGTDLWECINWRIGALMYMYIHEMVANDARNAAIGKEFIRECCMVGVCHLDLMLCSRAPLDPSENYTAHDAAIAQLLQEGVFSDIHMLALMYGGELCYWAWEVLGEGVKEGEKGAEGCSGGQSEGTKDNCAAEDSEISLRTASLKLGDDSHPTEPTPALFASLLVLLKGRDYVHQYWGSFSPSRIGQSLLTRYIKMAQGPLKNQNWNYARAVQLVVQLKRAAS